MDFAGPIGLVVAFVVIFVVMLIEGTSPTAVFLPGPLLLVWVTTLAVGLAGHTIKDAKGAFAAVPRALRGRLPQPDAVIDILVKLADKARREGLLALEDATRSIEDPFLRKEFEETLAKDGASSRMEPRFYEQPKEGETPAFVDGGAF